MTKIYLFIFLLIELGSSSAPVVPRSLDRIPDVFFYGDGYDRLLPLIAGSFHLVAAADEFIIGIYINDNIHPIFDRRQRQVIVNIENEENIQMTPYLHQLYDHHFVRFHMQPSPRLIDNAVPSASISKRRRHN